MEISAADLQNLRQVANQLLDIIERVAGDPVDVPEVIAKMVEEKMAKRICPLSFQLFPVGIITSAERYILPKATPKRFATLARRPRWSCGAQTSSGIPQGRSFASSSASRRLK